MTYPARFIPILQSCADGSLLPEIALLQLAAAADSAIAFQELLDEIARDQCSGCDKRALSKLVALAQGSPAKWEVVHAVIDPIGTGWQNAQSCGERVANLAKAFDRCAALSPAASVALYSFGDEARLAAMTATIVDRLRQWNVLGSHRSLLDIGCGIGRLEVALAPHLRHITAIDISPLMIELAKARCIGLDNISVCQTDGIGLAAFDDARFDILLAVDSFPYLVDCGFDVVTAHFKDARRILRPGGHFLILNFSYRNDILADRADIAALAQKTHFQILRNGEQVFDNWDGSAFCLMRTEHV